MAIIETSLQTQLRFIALWTRRSIISKACSLCMEVWASILWKGWLSTRFIAKQGCAPLGVTDVQDF